MKSIKLAQTFLEDKVKPYIDYLNKDELYERFNINNILYGVDLRVSEFDNIIFEVYNVRGVFGGHCGQMSIWVDPNTFDYKIKPKALYGSVESVNNGDIIASYTLSGNDKIVFDGIVANTLYQTFYGYYRCNHPIMDKHLQNIIFGKTANENL